MNAVGSLRKYAIDNRIDKEGDHDPRLIVTIEFKFTEAVFRSLAELTDGSQVVVDISEYQTTLFRGRGSPLDDPTSGVHGAAVEADTEPVADPAQPLLPWDGEIHPEGEDDGAEAASDDSVAVDE